MCFFYVAYLLLWRHNKEVRNVTTVVTGKKTFEQMFESSLTDLIKEGAIVERYEKTRYFYYAMLSLSLSISLFVCFIIMKLW